MTLDGLKIAIKNFEDDIDDQSSYYESLEDFTLYLRVRGREEKKEFWVHLLQQMFYLRDRIRFAFFNEVEEDVIQELKIEQTALSRARELAEEQVDETIPEDDRTTMLTQEISRNLSEARTQVREELDDDNIELESSRNTRRLEHLLSLDEKPDIQDFVDISANVVKEREIGNFISQNFPEDEANHFATQFIDQLVSSLGKKDQEYRSHVEDIYDSLTDTFKKGEDEEIMENLITALTEKQLKWHRESSGWPE